MTILLHQCCGPCSIHPLEVLRAEGAAVTAYFFNPNIHPVKEFYLRLENAVIVDDAFNVPVIIDETYGLNEFTKAVSGDIDGRCRYCYAVRLEAAAKKAAELGLDAFTSTLLYSRHQDHDLMIEIAKQAANRHGVEFYYRDFREGWQRGIDESIRMELYRQGYCGCVYSEEDRYREQLGKKFARKMKKREAAE